MVITLIKDYFSKCLSKQNPADSSCFGWVILCCVTLTNCVCVCVALYVCYCLYIDISFAAHMSSITSPPLTDPHSMALWQDGTFICILFLLLNKIHDSHYWYHHVFHSPGLSPSIFLCQFQPHHLSSSTSSAPLYGVGNPAIVVEIMFVFPT